jgi:hypothetical protein
MSSVSPTASPPHEIPTAPYHAPVVPVVPKQIPAAAQDPATLDSESTGPAILDSFHAHCTGPSSAASTSAPVPGTALRPWVQSGIWKPKVYSDMVQSNMLILLFVKSPLI